MVLKANKISCEVIILLRQYSKWMLLIAIKKAYNKSLPMTDSEWFHFIINTKSYFPLICHIKGANHTWCSLWHELIYSNLAVAWTKPYLFSKETLQKLVILPDSFDWLIVVVFKSMLLLLRLPWYTVALWFFGWLGFFLFCVVGWIPCRHCCFRGINLSQQR